MGIWRKRFQQMWCTEGRSVDFIRVDFHKGSPRLSGLPAHKNTTNKQAAGL